MLLAFIIGLGISAVGVVGIIAPSVLFWIARHFVTSAAFYVLAAGRIAFGLVLVSAASASRTPRALRIMGFVIVLLGVTTALTGLMAVGQARDAIEWWSQQGPGFARVTCLALIALGGFITWACDPTRRTGA